MTFSLKYIKRRLKSRQILGKNVTKYLYNILTHVSGVAVNTQYFSWSSECILGKVIILMIVSIFTQSDGDEKSVATASWFFYVYCSA